MGQGRCGRSDSALRAGRPAELSEPPERARCPCGRCGTTVPRRNSLRPLSNNSHTGAQHPGSVCSSSKKARKVRSQRWIDSQPPAAIEHALEWTLESAATNTHFSRCECSLSSVRSRSGSYPRPWHGAGVLCGLLLPSCCADQCAVLSVSLPAPCFPSAHVGCLEHGWQRAHGRSLALFALPDTAQLTP